jgi:hypothetical protein
MNILTLLEEQWAYLVSLMPMGVDLDESAKKTGALVRKRSIGAADQLLRLVFAYALVGMPLRQTAAWAQVMAIASLSNVALLKRLRGSRMWLGQLLGLKLAERSNPPAPRNSWKIRLVDATCVQKPGSKGTDWRVHLSYDLFRRCIDDLEVTDGKGGETLKRFRFTPAELVIGDRGYAHRPGIHHVAACQAYFIVRHNWNTVPLAEGFGLFAWLRKIPDAKAAEVHTEIAADNKRKLPALPIRVVALRKTEVATEAARRNLLREASKKGKVPDPRSLEMAGYICLLTNVPENLLPASEVLELYRFRWQIELAFKRLKSIMDLDELPAKDPGLARTYLYAKLLGALLLDDLTERFLGFSPWGYRLRSTPSVTVDDSASPA